MIQQIRHQQTAHHQRERDAHVNHRSFARLHPGLAQSIKTVAHGLNTRIRTGAQTVGPQQHRKQPDHARLCAGRLRIRHHPVTDFRKAAQMRGDGPQDRERIGADKYEKDGHPQNDRFLDPTQVKHCEKHHHPERKTHFIVLHPMRQHAERRIRAAAHA